MYGIMLLWASPFPAYPEVIAGQSVTPPDIVQSVAGWLEMATLVARVMFVAPPLPVFNVVSLPERILDPVFALLYLNSG